MLELALISSIIGIAALTALLVGAGRRPLAGRRWRSIAACGVVLAAGLGGLASSSPVPLAYGAAVAIVVSLTPRRWYAIGATFFAALMVATVAYAVYLVRATLILGSDALSLGLGAVLLLVELGAMGLILASAYEMVDALCAPADDAVPPAAPPRWPVVCLQVPTYNEPPELVIETIRSLVGLDYPALRVQVIDNNTTQEALWRPVEVECQRLREAGHAIDFVHLPEWPGFKAGALNWGRTHLAADVEIIGVVDADYVVQPDWLRTTVPFFIDSTVAFVQTPQDYRAWESSAFYRACYVGFAYFFRVGMVSRSHRNAIIFAGTMGLIRRRVLDEVGGWDERIITEDAEISLRVLARGYRSVYVPTAYGRGIMPLTYEGLRKQRFRWAFGGMQILRRHWRTILGRRSGLTVAQRYDHLIGGLWWFNDALTLGFTAFVAATAVGAAAGRPFVVQRLTALGLVLPVVLIVLNLVRYLWALRATTGASPPLALAALRVNLSLSWVIALACIRGLTQERGVFLRTPKFVGSAAIRELRLVWVETGLAAAAAVLLIVVLAQAGRSPAGLTLAGLLAWSVMIYGSATGFALGDPTRAPIGDGLRQKMALEVAPRIGRVARSRPARVGTAGAILASLAVVAAIASESGRAPIAELPFREVPPGPFRGPIVGAVPPPTPVPTGTSSPASATPAGRQPGRQTPGTGAVPPGGTGPSAAPPTRPPVRPAATPTPRPTPPAPATSAPTASPTAHPTPPVPIPTPTARPTPPPSPGHTPPPRPSPSPRRR
jgi:cellulose synthase/poly-beta-1,6-N-acetylglucosamine synthase-like glycosyltransferase